MMRWIVLGCWAALPFRAAAADTPQEQMARSIAVQSALKLARDALGQNHPKEAVALLEKHILLANGQTPYLELLRDAYRAAIKELMLKDGNAETIEHYRRQLRTLELSVGTSPAKAEGAAAAPAAPTKADGKPQVAEIAQPLAADYPTEPAPEPSLTREKPPVEKTEARNFRVRSTVPNLKADEVAQYAEQLRRQARERWLGTPGGDWKTPCEIAVYPSAAAYSAATKRKPDLPGHSTVSFEAGRVASRRIDLHVEAKGLFEAQLPKEINYLVLCELFADEPLPAWAEFGMTAQAEPAAFRSRDRRMVAKLIEEKKVPPFEKLFLNAAAPGNAAITSYYLVGTTLIDYLIRLKGPRTLVVFLQESPRRGYEKSLSQHYGIKSFAELERKWQADLLRGE